MLVLLWPGFALFNAGRFNDTTFSSPFSETNGHAGKRAGWAGYPSCHLNNANGARAPRSLKASVSPVLLCTSLIEDVVASTSTATKILHGRFSWR